MEKMGKGGGGGEEKNTATFESCGVGTTKVGITLAYTSSSRSKHKLD